MALLVVGPIVHLAGPAALTYSNPKTKRVVPFLDDFSYAGLSPTASFSGLGAENPAAVSPIDLIDHLVEVVAK